MYTNGRLPKQKQYSRSMQLWNVGPCGVCAPAQQSGHYTRHYFSFFLSGLFSFLVRALELLRACLCWRLVDSLTSISSSAPQVPHLGPQILFCISKINDNENKHKLSQEVANGGIIILFSFLTLEDIGRRQERVAETRH